MKRYDLRHLHDDFYDRMVELIDNGLKVGEAGIFLFEVGDFSSIQKSADVIKETGHDLMNSLKFNEVDWTVVVKKVDEEVRKERAEKIAVAKAAAEKAAKEAEEAAALKAAEEAKAKEEAEKAAAEAKAKEAAAKAEAEKKAEEEAKAKEEAEKAAAEEAEAEKKATEEAAAKEAAAKLNISERSIHHYFKILKTFGYRIYYSYGRQSYIYEKTPVKRNITETENMEVTV